MRHVLPSAGRPAAAAVVVDLLAATLVATAGTPASAERPAHAAHSAHAAHAAHSAHAAPAAHVTDVTVRRGGPDKTLSFHRSHAGEVFWNVTVSARGVSWADRGNESAVVSAYVDGHYATDVVIGSAGRVKRQFALGHLGAGRHSLRLHYASGRSPSDAGVARLQQIGFATVRPSSPAYLAAEYAPVLYGRNLRDDGGRFENNRTDTPLLAWHETVPAARSGHSIIEYSVVWSNEDGGTATSALMARWGRTTDIEWVYRVEVNARGRRVPGTGVFQSADHGTTRFHGRYDGTHPLLETCTSNNNMCDTVHDPMRFALSARNTRRADQPREHLMDRHPWTYQVMAREMLREHQVESPSDPASLAMGDQRTYLYVAVDHTTDPASSAGVVGLEVDVVLRDDPTTYTSDHANPYLTVNRDGPAATTVELPAGTTPADVASISVLRVPVGVPPDTTASLTVTAITRGFFLGSAYLPKPSFVRWRGSRVLTYAAPGAELWTRSG